MVERPLYVRWFAGSNPVDVISITSLFVEWLHMRQALGSITGWDFQLESSARTLFLVSSPTPGGIGRGFNSRIVHVFFEAQKYTTTDYFCPHVHKTIVRQNHDMRLLVLGICLTWCTYFLQLRSTLRRILFTHTFTKPLSDKTRTCFYQLSHIQNICPTKPGT